MRNSRRIVVLCLALPLLASCATVEPWQRERLARWDMALEPDPLEAQQRDHVYFSKEGTAGRVGAAGGGCGCN